MVCLSTESQVYSRVITSSSSSSSILIILISSLSRERVYDVCYKNGARKCFSVRLFRRVRWNVSSKLSTTNSIFLRNDSFQEVQNAHGDLRNRDQVETGEETDVTEYHADEDEKIENR